MIAAGSDTKESLWRRHAWIAYLAVLMGVLGHASSEFVAKIISTNAPISGPEVSVWRFFLGGLGLVAISMLIPASRDLVTPMWKNGVALVVFSVFGVAGAYLFFHWALDYATVPQVATVVTTAPIFVGLINQYVNKVAFGTAKYISGLGAVAGVAFLITDGALLTLAGDASNLIGIFMAIMCALLLSVYLVLIKPYVAEFGALRITAVTLFLGGLVLWVGVGLLFGRWVAFWTFGDLAAPAMAGIVVLVLYNTTLTQWLWIGGLAAVPDITRGTYLFFSQTGDSGVPGGRLFGYPPQPLAGAGDPGDLQRRGSRSLDRPLPIEKRNRRLTAAGGRDPLELHEGSASLTRQ